MQPAKIDTEPGHTFGAIVARHRDGRPSRISGIVWLRVGSRAPGVQEYWESLTPAERAERGVPSQLLTTEQVATAVADLAGDASLAGRVLVWWSEGPPRLIAWGDRGYRDWVTAERTGSTG